MSLLKLFLSFDGRANRAQFWLVLVTVLVASALVEWACGIPLNGDDIPTARLRVIDFVITLVTVVPLTAIAVKRLHDRDQPGYKIWPLLAAFAVMLFGTLTGYFDTTQPDTMVRWGAMLFQFVITLAYLVHLGFWRGTPGDNTFGRAPNAAREPRPA
jgi:uncharacterized membrane protein YhaH (DUF805 family)